MSFEVFTIIVLAIIAVRWMWSDYMDYKIKKLRMEQNRDK